MAFIRVDWRSFAVLFRVQIPGRHRRGHHKSVASARPLTGHGSQMQAEHEYGEPLAVRPRASASGLH